MVLSAGYFFFFANDITSKLSRSFLAYVYGRTCKKIRDPLETFQAF